MFNIPAIILVLLGLCVLLQLVRQFLLTGDQDIWLLFMFAFIPARYAQPDLAASWQALASPFTYSFLHGSYGHLINNGLWLVAFGSPLASTIGARRFIAFWFLCAAIGALFHYLAQPESLAPMIGASGAIAGMMGAAARFGFRMEKTENGNSHFLRPLPGLSAVIAMPGVLAFLGLYLLLNLGIGLFEMNGNGSQIAWQAHLGGIFAGFIALPLFLRSR